MHALVHVDLLDRGDQWYVFFNCCLVCFVLFLRQSLSLLTWGLLGGLNWVAREASENFMLLVPSTEIIVTMSRILPRCPICTVPSEQPLHLTENDLLGDGVTIREFNIKVLVALCCRNPALLAYKVGQKHMVSAFVSR